MATPPVATRKRDRILSWFRTQPVDNDAPVSKDESREESSSPEKIEPIKDDPAPVATVEVAPEETPQDLSLKLWDAAYQQLKADSAELMAEYESALEAADPAAAALRDGTPSQRVQAMQAVVAQASVSKHGEKAVAAAETAAKVLDLIKDTVTGLAQANPVAAFAWAGFCVIAPHMLAPIMEKKDMRDGLGHVSDRLSWFMALTKVLLRENWSDDAEFGQFRQEVYRRTTKLYRKLLEFQVRCVCACASPWKTAAKDMLGWNGWGDLVASLKSAEAELDDKIRQYSTEATKEHLREIASQSRHLEDMVAFQQRAEDREIAEQRNKTIAKFNQVNYDDVANAVPERVPGTCAWLSHDDTYRRWCQNAESAPEMLIITAGPGWGKSVLTKYLVKERLQEDLDGAWTVCSFFFNNNRTGMNSASNALHAILHQLLSKQRHLVDSVTDEVGKLGSGPISISSLINMLGIAMSSADAAPMAFVFDALDECNPAELSDIVRFLQSARLPNVRLVVTTRPWPNILEDLEVGCDPNETTAVIAAETLQHDIMLQEEILMVLDHNLDKILKKYDENFKSKMRTALISKVDKGERTYLWLKLVMESLKTARLKDDLERLANKPPKGLYDAYSLLLSHVDPEHRDRLATLFDLILVAQRPLTLEEASVALWIRTHPETSSLEQVDADEVDGFHKWVVETSGFFVLVFHGKLFFIHQTCREYLLRSVEILSPQLSKSVADVTTSFANSTTEPRAHATVAECCLLYLLLQPFSNGDDEDEPTDTDSGRDVSSFMKYSSIYFTLHFGLSQRYEKVSSDSGSASSTLVDINPSLRPLYLRLFHKQLGSKDGSLKFYQPYCGGNNAPDLAYAEYLIRDGGLLLRYISAGFGIDSNCRSKSSIYITLQGKKSEQSPTLRTLGCLTGHLALFQEGGDEDLGKPEPPIDVYYNVEKEPALALDRYFTKPAAPLYRASAMDGAHIVKWLADKGVDLSAQDDDDDSALHAAVHHPFVGKHRFNASSVGTLKVLLEAGVSPSIANSSGLTPLMSAAKLMNWDAVQCLMDQGASPNVADKRGVTPLMLATLDDETPEGARILLEGGADVNASDCNGRTALHWAFRSPSAAIIDVLISHGIDVNRASKSGSTALGAAMEHWGREMDYVFDDMFVTAGTVTLGPNDRFALQERVEKGLGLLDQPVYVEWKAEQDESDS